MTPTPPTLALTPGEPAGIGPDLAVQLAQTPLPCRLVAIGDPDLLRQRARKLGLPLTVVEPGGPDGRGRLAVVPEPLQRPAIPGRLDPGNAGHVLRCLDRAIDGCISGEFDAMVTAPVHKGVINEAGVPFTGHTEYISARTGSETPVMMLATPTLRVALVTTHVPLAKVSGLITRSRLEQTLRVLADEMEAKFGIPNPRIAVCGLNPHAGENGHLGREEIEVIGPAVEAFRRRGYAVCGPLPADTVFVPRAGSIYHVVLCMYHDQGLPVIKQQGFGEAVNVTLGIPIIRTSVDHGTALALAGTGAAQAGSCRAAVHLAADLVLRSRASDRGVRRRPAGAH